MENMEDFGGDMDEAPKGFRSDEVIESIEESDSIRKTHPRSHRGVADRGQMRVLQGPSHSREDTGRGRS